MKKFFISNRCAAVLGLLVAASPMGGSANAATPVSPVGPTWDCIMGGKREGVAILHFYDDLTFTAYQVLVPKLRKNEPTEARLDGSEETRAAVSESPSSSTEGTQIFGAGFTTGQWSYDNKGRVIGFFSETSGLTCTTNTTAIETNRDDGGKFPIFATNFVNDVIYCVTMPVATNSEGTVIFNQTICYSNALTCTATTNLIGFRAKVAAYKRLSIVASTPFGKVSYKGVPAKSLQDISGNWYGLETRGHQKFTDLFTMENVSTDDFPNFYSVSGDGAAGSFSGIALLSVQKRLGLVTSPFTDSESSDDSTPLRAVIGSFNFKKVSSKTHGWDQPAGVFTNRVAYTVTRKLFP